MNFGNDYDSYVDFFIEFHSSNSFYYDENSHAEYGYQLLNYIMPSFRSILVLNTFLLCFSLAVFIYRNVPKNYFWLVIILIFLNVEKNIYGPLVGTRNGFAIALFLLSTVFIQKRIIWAFAGMVAVAMQFHSTALFYMPIAYFVGRNKRITKTEIIIWFAVAVFLLISSLSGLVSFLEPYLVEYNEGYTLYIESGVYHRGWLLTMTGLVLLSLTFYHFWNNKEKFDSDQNSVIRVGLLYIMTTLLGSAAFRAGYFYDMFFIATVVLLLTKSKKEQYAKVLCFLAIMVSLYSFFLWRSVTSGNYRYDIYQSVFGILF